MSTEFENRMSAGQPSEADRTTVASSETAPLDDTERLSESSSPSVLECLAEGSMPVVLQDVEMEETSSNSDLDEQEEAYTETGSQVGARGRRKRVAGNFATQLADILIPDDRSSSHVLLGDTRGKHRNAAKGYLSRAKRFVTKATGIPRAYLTGVVQVTVLAAFLFVGVGVYMAGGSWPEPKP